MFEFLIIFIVSATGINYNFRAKGYKGPISDHFDGKRFKNILEYFSARDKRADKSFHGPSFLIKKLLYTHWKKRALSETITQPAERIIGSHIVSTFINHSTVLIQTEGLNILTDPVWTKRASPFSFLGPPRYMLPGLMLSDLPKIDIILLSHNHYDHMDIGTLQFLSKRDHPTIYTTLGNADYLKVRKIFGAIDMDWGDTKKYSDTLTVDCVPAQHFSARGLTDRNKTLWGGFVLRASAGDIYFAGDTGYGPFISRIQKSYPNGFRLAYLPIGAFEPRWFMHVVHMGPDDALMMYSDLKVSEAIAIHLGTFDLGIDGQDDAEKKLAELLKEDKNKNIKFTVLTNGTSVTTL